MHQALYRQFRSKTFEELTGQEHIVKILKNQIASGKISHAYLFNGGRGIGKTSVARIFAKAINCLGTGVKPCYKCEQCKLKDIENLDIIEIDAASNNGVDSIRELRETVKFLPVNSKYKVYIVDEVHMLSDGAFNAFLKTLEEPPSHVVFILATTEAHKLPATVLSRCMRFDFKQPTVAEISTLLRKVLTDAKITFDEESIEAIAEAADGSFRDALSIADSVAAAGNMKLESKAVVNMLGAISKKEVETLANAIVKKDEKKTVQQAEKLLSEGKAVSALIKELMKYFKNIVLEHAAKGTRADALVYASLEKLAELEVELKNTLSPRLLFTVCLINTINTKG
ncbi:MAG: DNA polymerase III subunit gamma/tau [Firmicutes bacterium]|nr:DNA polymerase III subunit gamma/tau [Bacillota bacterium]